MTAENLPFWALTAAYAAHILEEYVLDWRGWACRISGVRMEWEAFFVANAAVIVLGIACSAVGFVAPWFSFLFVGLAVVNAVFAHIGTSIVKRMFSPGLLTSVTLFLPIAGWAYATAAQKGVLAVPLLLGSLGGGLLIMAFPILLQWIRKKIVKNEQSGI